MKNSLLMLVMVVSFVKQSFSRVYIDLEIENQIRQDATFFTQECKKYEALFEKTFPSTGMSEIHEQRLNNIPKGSLHNKVYYKEVWDVADQILSEIEQFSDYQDALKKAKKENTNDAWNILIHEIVYYYVRKITQEKSDLIFPSLVENDSSKSEKIKKFCLANCAIDIEKNAPYLAATALILYYFKQLQKNHMLEIKQYMQNE